LDRWPIVNADIIALIGDRYPLLHLFEVRQTFEVGAARLAARRRTESDLAELSRPLEQTVSDTRHAQQVEADQAFHRALAQATHNPLFLPLFNAIIDPLCQYWSLSQVLPGITEETYKGHLAIYNCVVDRDEAGAAQAMEEHLRAGHAACQRLLDRSQSNNEGSNKEGCN
jgi:GntR family transcriptional repressor for pyruvate dehydrogenase complex